MAGVTKLLLLVADDSQDDYFFLKRGFTKAGLPHTLFNVRGGLEAIAYLNGEAPFANRHEFPRPDLLILDIKMPAAGGFAVLQWLRENPHLSVPAIVLSGSVIPEDKEKALRLGAREYFLKPVLASQLTELAMAIDSRWIRPRNPF